MRMARARLSRQNSWLDRYVPFGLWAGQTSGVVCLAFALALTVFSSARPGAMVPVRASAQMMLAPTLATFSVPFIHLGQAFDYLYQLTHLQTEVAKLRVENARLHDWFNTAQLLQAENTSLRGLLNVKLDPPLTFITTRVIGDLGGPYAQTLLINAGTRNGVKKDDTVMAGTGVIGRIMDVTDQTATVLLITDLNSRVPVRIDGGGLQAILAGTSRHNLVLDRIPDGSSVMDNARVVTSGVGGVFPPDLPIGSVRHAHDGTVMVAPDADFARILFVRVVGTTVSLSETRP